MSVKQRVIATVTGKPAEGLQTAQGPVTQFVGRIDTNAPEHEEIIDATMSIEKFVDGGEIPGSTPIIIGDSVTDYVVPLGVENVAKTLGFQFDLVALINKAIDELPETRVIRNEEPTQSVPLKHSDVVDAVALDKAYQDGLAQSEILAVYELGISVQAYRFFVDEIHRLDHRLGQLKQEAVEASLQAHVERQRKAAVTP